MPIANVSETQIQKRTGDAFAPRTMTGKRGTNAFAVPWAIMPARGRLPEASMTQEKKKE
jgi:hypothetical protein